MTLLAQIETTKWSEEAIDLFELLARYKASDEGALIVLSAAALLLSRQARDEDALFALMDEFGEIVERFRGAFRPAPRLEVVGGRDVGR